ncbi:HNH endonuclease signature motif containing protein [Stenotrophomonas maltophilia]|uniref:HNH endonuclease signature motif containing protein n=1 Tax=Stenotrophomonas maltophilia TaxID=40324 RepID=UPI000C15BE46|nr:HNH endonuclease signature motif containing protein [Stenotrophomonas maltophilia]MCO7494705.1 HNH endonuclease [Stenotrophomonas maltophilia]
MNQITAQDVREKYDYNPDTGVFVFRAGKKAGMVCGAVHPDGYLLIAVKNKCQRAHRMAWLYVHGEHPAGEIDHINGVRDDNRIENLRVTDRRGNMQNLHGPKKNSRCSSVGVSYRPKTGQYVARIQTVGGRLYLGCFRNELDASNAYQAAKKIHHQVAA